MNKDYKTINNVVQEHDETTPLQESSDLSIRKRNVVVYAAIFSAFLLVALVTSFKAGEASAATSSTSKMRSPSKTIGTTIDTCADIACNDYCEKDHYLCYLNAFGESWRCYDEKPSDCVKGLCYCPPPDTNEPSPAPSSCVGVQCQDSICLNLGKYSGLCGPYDKPYFCTAESEFPDGIHDFQKCMSNPLGFNNDPECDQCCDVHTCA